jgi:PAS domain S-box-containing protein
VATCDLISIATGITVLAAAFFKRPSSWDLSITRRLPELTVAIYLVARGIVSAFSYSLDSSLILLFLPPAAAAAQRSSRNKKTSSWVTLGVSVTFVIAVGLILAKSYWHLPDAYVSLVSALAIVYLAVAMFFFKDLTMFLLGLSALTWAMDLLGLPVRSSLLVALIMGAMAGLSVVFDWPISTKDIFAFDLGNFIDAVATPLLILSPFGKIVYTNDEFLKAGGYDRDSLLQGDAAELFDIPSDWRFRSSPANMERKIQCHLICKNGERVPIILWLNEIHNSQKTICNLLCMVQEQKDRELLENRIKSESALFAALYDTSLALSSSLEIKDVLEAIASAAESLTRADSCTILSLEHSRQVLRPIYSSDEKYNAEVMNFEIPVGQGLTGAVVNDGKPRIQNYDDESSLAVLVPGTEDEEDESLLSVPLMAKDLVIGALTLYKTGERRFEDDDIRILTVFASQASAVIENSRLYMKLKASEKLYRFSVDLAGDAIFFVDLEKGKIADSNDKAQKLFKYTKSELASMHIWELHPEPVMHVARKLWQEARKIGWARLGEIEYRSKTGLKIPAAVTISIIFTGEYSLIQWIVRDISEHKNALEKAGLVQQIFEALDEPILITDVKGRSLYANKAFCKAFRVAPDQIARGNIAALGLENQRIRDLASFQERLRENDTFTDRIAIETESGERQNKQITILPFRGDQNILKYHVWLFSPLPEGGDELKVNRRAEVDNFSGVKKGAGQLVSAEVKNK